MSDTKYLGLTANKLAKIAYDLETENAKLREMVRDVGNLLLAIDADYCAACQRDSINHPCPVYTVGSGECLYKVDLRELGIEVDDV